jgi:ketosteroid isomerase-like protein
MTRETEALREIYAAINRNDIATAVEAFAPEFEWIEPVEYQGGGTYRGLEAVTAHLTRGRGSWAEGSCEPERFLVAGDQILMFLSIRVRLSHETEWREGRHVEVYTFRDGKAIQNRIFPNEEQAFAWVGISG